MSEVYEVRNNEQQMHFEILQGDDVAFLEYRYYKKDIVLMHTQVPESMKGKGVAGALTAHAFNFAKRNNKPVIVYCHVVAAYLEKHPELRDQLAKQDLL